MFLFVLGIVWGLALVPWFATWAAWMNRLGYKR